MAEKREDLTSNILLTDTEKDTSKSEKKKRIRNLNEREKDGGIYSHI